MAMLVWTPKYSVNIREIDQQHQRLFTLLNELYDAMQEGRGRKIVGNVLDRLIDYTAYHFDTEEALFREHGYAEAPVHRAEHTALTQRAKTLKRRFDAGEVQVTSETLRFLGEWLNGHIMGSDMKYVAFLNGKGVH